MQIYWFRIGSVEDHRIRAEVLEEQETQFAEEFLDARDEAANVRTVTDENILDAAATKGMNDLYTNPLV